VVDGLWVLRRAPGGREILVGRGSGRREGDEGDEGSGTGLNGEHGLVTC